MMSGNGGQLTETDTESEIQTEYSDDFEISQDEDHDHINTTVIEKPSESQSTPLLHTQNPRRQRRSVRNRTLKNIVPDTLEMSKENNLMASTEILHAINGMRKDFSETMGIMRKFVTKSLSSAKQNDKKVHRRDGREHRSINYVSDSESRRTFNTDEESDEDESIETDSSKGRQISGSRLPIFTGKERWRVWFNRFETVANLNMWNDKERLTEMLPRLQGAAGEFVFDQLPGSITTSYKRLIKELDSRFGEVDTRKIYVNQFNNRKQLGDETVQDFAAELKRLYDKGYPKRDKVTRQEDLLAKFLLGLNDDNARCHVELNKEPNTIEEAVYYTLNYQEICKYPQVETDYFTKNMYSRRKPVRQVQNENYKLNAARPTFSAKNEDTKRNNDYYKQKEEEKNDGKSSTKLDPVLVETIKKMVTELVHSNQTNQQQTQSVSSRSHQDKRCFNCGESGHFSRQCTHPRQKPRENWSEGKFRTQGQETHRNFHYDNQRQPFNREHSLNTKAPAFVPASKPLN